MASLQGLTVAVTEHRFEREFAALLERQGARILACPLLEETPVEDRAEVRRFVDKVLSGSFDMIVFLTGVGARFLFEEAERMGRTEAFQSALQGLTVVARGPKPVATLHRAGVRVDVKPESPTSEGIVEALKARDLRGTRVGIQLYGEPNPALAAALQERGAEVDCVQVYRYGPGSDDAEVRRLVEALLGEEVDVITFTSAPQVRRLFGVAEAMGKAEALRDRLNARVVVAVIGEVANRALVERAVTARVQPAEPKMAALVKAIAEFVSASAR